MTSIPHQYSKCKSEVLRIPECLEISIVISLEKWLLCLESLLQRQKVKLRLLNYLFVAEIEEIPKSLLLRVDLQVHLHQEIEKERLKKNVQLIHTTLYQKNVILRIIKLSKFKKHLS
jgi:hypothetical protein